VEISGPIFKTALSFPSEKRARLLGSASHHIRSPFRYPAGGSSQGPINYHKSRVCQSIFLIHVFNSELHSGRYKRISRKTVSMEKSVQSWQRSLVFDHHLITLSALANTFGGTIRPICLAVFRLMMNSNFVGCSTGKSAATLAGRGAKNRRQNLKTWDEHELRRQDQS
jgi:hypothetical protein